MHTCGSLFKEWTRFLCFISPLTEMNDLSQNSHRRTEDGIPWSHERSVSALKSIPLVSASWVTLTAGSWWSTATDEYVLWSGVNWPGLSTTESLQYDPGRGSTKASRLTVSHPLGDKWTRKSSEIQKRAHPKSKRKIKCFPQVSLQWSTQLSYFAT